MTDMDLATYKKNHLKPQIKQQKRNKYNAIKTAYNGVVYDSKKEAGFASHLEYLKHAKDPKEKVVSVKRQVPFPIKINNRHICNYIADFVVRYGDKSEKVFDVKGMKTAIYKLKKKMVEAQYKIIINEV